MTRILTYNIHSCVGEDGVYNVSRVASVVNSTGASIVCLQEIESNITVGRARIFSATHGDNQPAMIAERCGLEHVFFLASVQANVESEGGSEGEILRANPGIRYGNCILSKYPILDRRVLHYRPKSRSALRIKMDKEEQPRTAQAALMDVKEMGGKIWIVNTHFCHLPWRAAHKRQANQLLEWIQNLRSKYPIVLCGDFNAPPSLPGTTYRIILNSRLVGTWRDLCASAGVTFPSSYYQKKQGLKKWLYGKFYHFKLDHILTTSQRLEAKTCEVVNQTKDSVVASDHCGLLCDVISS